ncbi:condensation domain-containing protein [Kitasatospora sp. NPDC101235]|uniref:condensation domain-containing protein n=1 Tax=Kitasatospora sp. NPDC101235 TaxID=3364101 RepID=UPI00380A54D8
MPTDPATTTVPLTRGHFHALCRAVDLPAEERHTLVVTLFAPLPEGLDTEAPARALELLVARHDALRSTVVRTAGGEWAQRVHPPARQALRTADLGDLGPDGVIGLSVALAEEVQELHGTTPLRAVVITDAGAPVYVLVALHHYIVDLEALRRLQDEFGQLLMNVATGADADAGLRPALPLVARTALERSPEGRRADDEAQAHWSRLLRDAANVSFPYHRDDRSPRTARVLSLASPAVDHALARLSAEAALTPTALVLAAFHTMLSAYTGGPLVWSLLMGKPAPERGATLVESTLETVHVPLLALRFTPDGGPSVLDTARDTLTRLLEATRHRDYDYARFLESRASHAADRGALVAWEVTFNSRLPTSMVHRDGGPPPPTTAYLLPRSRTRWKLQYTAQPTVAVSAGSDGRVTTLDLACDTDLLDKDTMTAVLGGVEALLVAAADGSTAPPVEAVRPATWPRRPDWTLVDGTTWTDLTASRDLLASHPGICGVDLTVTPGRPPALRAVVHARTATLTGDDVRRHALHALYRPGQTVPRTVDVRPCAIPGCLRCSTDTPAQPAPPRPDALAALGRAVTEALGQGPADIGAGFLSQGGRAAAYPEIKISLERAGWTGLTAEALLAPRSLAHIAASLRPVRREGEYR